MNQINKISYCFFFNGERGIQVLNFFKKKKFNISNVFIAKKFLTKKILKKLPKKIKFKLIDNLDQKVVVKALKDTDIALSCGFPLLFKRSILKLPRRGFLNCHAGLLPKYRGGSPLNWQMINGEKKFGISVIKLNSKIDGGDIFSERKFDIKKNFDITDLHKIANKNFPQMVIESIKKLIEKKKPKKKKSKGIIWKQRTKSDSYFDYQNKTFFQADRFVKALLDPYPNAFFYFKNKKYEILKIIRSNKKLKPGEIFFSHRAIYLGLKDATVKAKLKNTF